MAVARLVFCEYCGGMNESIADFCVQCGRRLDHSGLPSCVGCGRPVHEGDRYCGSCGATLPEVMQRKPEYCKECGTPFELGSRFCHGCGHPIADAQDDASSIDDSASTTLYGMPRIPDAVVIYGPPDLFRKRRGL